MAITLNTGSGGASIESFQRSGTDHRQVLEHGYVPTFIVLTPAIVATANRFQLVVYNNNATALVQIRKTVWIPTSNAAVTSVLPGAFTQRIRTGPTTNPTGTGGVTPISMDSADSLPASIEAFCNPGTAPAGGTAKDLLPFIPQPDEVKVSTLDSPTQIMGYPFCGVTLYEHRQLGPNSKPITLRQDQCYEVQQSATAGTMSSYRLFCVFTAI